MKINYLKSFYFQTSWQSNWSPFSTKKFSSIFLCSCSVIWLFYAVEIKVRWKYTVSMLKYSKQIRRIPIQYKNMKLIYLCECRMNRLTNICVQKIQFQNWHLSFQINRNTHTLIHARAFCPRCIHSIKMRYRTLSFRWWKYCWSTYIKIDTLLFRYNLISMKWILHFSTH